MSQTERDRLATIIRTWNDGSGLMQKLPAEMQAADERLVGALLARLRAHVTMPELADAYLTDAWGWPVGLPPLTTSQRSRQGVIVATAYWRRYQQLLARVTDRTRAPGPMESERSEPRPDPGPGFGPIEMAYTAKLWQRGPARLQALRPDRRARYEALVELVEARLASCRTVRGLAARYYGDGDWVLQLARERLLPLGEPVSGITWVQDAAFWRRYQEIVAARADVEPDGPPPTFAIWLAGQMSRRRLSVAEVAHRLGTLEEVVRSWIHAAQLPGPDDARRVATAFGVPESQLPRLDELCSA